MERYCGFLKHALRSRSQPWRNLDERIKQFAHLAQLRVKYDLHEEIPPQIRRAQQPSSVERVYPECEQFYAIDNKITHQLFY